MSCHMRRLIVLLTIGTLLAVSAGCRQPEAEPLYRGAQSIQWDGLERTFNVHLPPSYTASQDWPVVVVLHGGGGSASQVERSTGFSDTADEEGFIAVYPNGTGFFDSALLTWNAGHCCGYALGNGIDDVGFFRTMMSEIGSRLSIDSSHIYVTGMSNGAMMAYRLGAECPDIITAIAPVAGAIGGRATTNAPLWLPSQPAHPVSVLAIHGTADPHVLYDGGHGPDMIGTRVDVSVAESIDFWIKANGCDPQPRTTPISAGVVRVTYSGGFDGPWWNSLPSRTAATSGPAPIMTRW